MYKKALKLKLRLLTPKGSLSVEQAMSLSMKDLEASIESAHAVIKETSSDDEALGFLNKTSTVKEEDQLAFDILKDIYLDKRGELDSIADARSKKEHNAEILAIIAEKEKESLRSMSVDDLKKQLK